LRQPTTSEACGPDHTITYSGHQVAFPGLSLIGCCLLLESPGKQTVTSENTTSEFNVALYFIVG